MVKAVGGGAQCRAHGADAVDGRNQAADGRVGQRFQFRAACGAGEVGGSRTQGRGHAGHRRAQVDGHGFRLRGTDLEGHRAGDGAARQQFLAAEGRVVHDVGQFQAQCVVFGLHGVFVGGVRRGIGSLRGQILHTHQHVGDFGERAFSRLQQRGAVLRVAHGNGHAAGLCFQAGGDLQAGCVIHGRVDAVAGAQAGHRGRQLRLGLRDRILCGQRCVVGVKAQHGVAPV
ncbi:hypothetical protein D3C81_219710 [compost metagenome]